MRFSLTIGFLPITTGESRFTRCIRPHAAERRHDLIASLQQHYRVSEIVDYSPYEERGLYLEGTGSLVLDHENRIAYVSLSRRANRELLEKFCADFDYEPVTFRAAAMTAARFMTPTSCCASERSSCLSDWR